MNIETHCYIKPAIDYYNSLTHWIPP